MKPSALLVVLAAVLAPGCAMIQIGVTNPIPGLSTVAVAPFLNLSAERATDGRRFALAYATELQKVPGFEVLPVGVTETAMVDAKIDLNDVDDVIKLAKVLRVDAVVVGAITDYSPYYPPRIGLQVSWYSPRAWAFYPGIQTEPAARQQLHDWDKQQLENYHENQNRIDESCAPETPFWTRAYNCFKRWPVIRNVYGEPTLALNGSMRPDSRLVWRAQSPGMGDSPYGSQLPSPDGSAPGPLTKIAHYQEANAPQEVIPSSLTASKLQSADPSQNQTLVPVPRGPLPEEEEGDDPNGPDGKQPGSGPPVPPLPTPSPTHLRNPPEPRGLAPLREGGGQTFAEPFGPEPNFLPPLPGIPGPVAQPMPAEAPPIKLAVRNPCTAPLPPQPNPFNAPQPIQPWQLDPHLPLMSYTRIFDGADADLVAALRDYVELGGDLRSGGWEEYLHRSEDFIRFTAYRMILEMLSLHGGEGKHRLILKFRKYK
ncbi:MAG TPA: hypothetical protein VFG04_11590 [Planctomycetaceae bacterium]|nr:hypothetical protein [Planctomycetaceae bacterium]